MKALSLPIFLPLVVWGWLIALVEMVFYPARGIRDTGPTSSAWATAGYFALVVLLAFLLQVTIGVLSRTMLRRSGALGVHLAVGAVVACALSGFAAFCFRAPQFGEPLQKLLPFCLLFFVPRFLIGYYCAFTSTHQPRSI